MLFARTGEMQITPRLLQIASVLIAASYGAACSSSSDSASSFDGGGGPDAGNDAQPGCGGCGCTGADTGAPLSLTAAQACDLLASNDTQTGAPGDVYGATCQTYCPTSPFCAVAADFAAQFAALNSDGGTTSDGGIGDGGSLDGGSSFQCPTQTAPVIVTCGQYGCLGRLTEGFVAPQNETNWGERFAAMAFLEAVSVHAFDRLERELRSHGAAPALLRDARRARRDEQRHTVMMAALARRNGCEARLPDAPVDPRVRSLFEITLENAVEGCVRETYGAVVGLIEGETSTSPAVRRAMRAVSIDECRHAELAWAVHAWAMPQLSTIDAERVRAAMRSAIAEIASRDAKTAALLFDESSTRLVA